MAKGIMRCSLVLLSVIATSGTALAAGLPDKAAPVKLDYQPPVPVDHPASQPQEASKGRFERLHDAIDSTLPIGGDWVRKRGYTLPEPYGLGYNYMDMRQNIQVKSIEFSHLAMFGIRPIPSSAIQINAGHTREKSKTNTARLDAWLFPFMNIYGIVGHTKGESNSTVDINSCIRGRCNEFVKGMDFKLKFKGTTYGAGTTLAYGYHDWFGTMDFNYTRTTFDVLDGQINAFTFTPRVGYRFTVPATPNGLLPPSHLSLWVGTMYQDVTQDFKGSISDLHMPEEVAGLVRLVDMKKEGRFRVKQHLSSPWNVLVGGNYEMTRNFNITTEVGFAKRNSVMVAGEFRF